MKFTPVFGLVLVIHVGVIALLIVQPGCNTTPEPEPGVADTLPQGGNNDINGATTTVVRPAGSRSAPRTTEAYSEPSTLDAAFNSGFSPSDSGAGRGPASTSRPGSATGNSSAGGSQGDRSPPRRPTAMFSDPLPEMERPDPVPVVSNTPRFETYTVQSGDSLWKIAKDYDVTLSSLLEANNLTKNSVIKVGQKIQVPLTAPELAPAPPAEETFSGTSMEMQENTPYTVQRGDTLSRIARTFDTSVDAIKAANNRRSDTIRVGETLMIPGNDSASGSTNGSASSTDSDTNPGPGTPEPGPGQATHLVEPGETPASIAARYGMRTIDLIRLNGNFDPRRMQAGQTLIVEPAPGRQPSALAAAEPPADNSRSASQTRPREIPSVQQQRQTPQPIRVRVGEPADGDTDPSPVDMDNLEEIPVVPVEPVGGNG